jgi:hypothetical protein
MNKSKPSAAITPRKLIGTLALAFVLAVGAFGTAKAAQALFMATGPTLIFDGIVGTVGDGSFTAFTNSTDPVAVDVTNHTVISPSGSLSDLHSGDSVKVIAIRQDGALVAQVVTVESNISGYGTAGNTVLLNPATVVLAGDDSFVVDAAGVDTVIHVNDVTRWFNTSLSQLQAGDKLVVIGQDTGNSSSGFVAQDVFK